MIVSLWKQAPALVEVCMGILLSMEDSFGESKAKTGIY